VTCGSYAGAGMKERLAELQDRVRGARAALEDLASRAAELRGRVEAARTEDPPYATVPAVNPPAEPPGRDPFMPIAPGAPLASALDRLTQRATVTIATLGVDDGDDGRFVSDAWEIALINEEGK
jgi:hypothetical protein